MTRLKANEDSQASSPGYEMAASTRRLWKLNGHSAIEDD